MIVNLTAHPKDSTSNLTVRDQVAPLPNIKPVRVSIIMTIPGLTAEPPTPDEIAAAVWTRVGRTLTA